YITRVTLSEDAFEKRMLVKMYSSDDNTLNVYELADRVTIDEVKYEAEKYKDIALAFPGNTTLSGDKLSIERQVIRYTLDKDGKIDKIDTRKLTENEDKDTTLHRTTNGVESLVFTYGTSCLGMSQYIDRSTIKYLVVPNTDENGNIVVNGHVVEDDVSRYSNKHSIEDWQTYNVELYKYSPDTLGNDLVVVYTDAKSVDYNLIMYSETTEGLDDDGSISKVLTGYSLGAEVNVPIDSTINIDEYNLKKGDVVYVDMDNRKKKIVTLTKMYDAETNRFEDNGSLKDPDRYWYGGTYSNEGAGAYRGIYYQLSRGYALDTKGKLTSISYTLPLAYEGKASEVITTSSIPITIYDKSKDKNQMYGGTASDILTYKTAGDNCDLVLVNAKQSSRIQLFVIRD
ncbi:MAG: hypothetical protein Q4E94_03765, partial [Clostridia bacterium]|nr:hypothetical protein [Clostridia bacterium]